MLNEPGDSRRRRLGMDRRSAYHHVLSAIPEDVGPRVATFGGGAVHTIRPPGSQTFVDRNHFVGVMLAPSRGITVAFASDKMQTFDAPTGTLVICPANVDSKGHFPSSRESVVIAIEPGRLLDLAMLEFDMETVELQPPPFGTVDPVALQFAKLLKVELNQSEPASELYIDSLITSFSIHLLRKYTGGRKRPVSAKGGLSVHSARRVQEYMAENFARKLPVAELAALCDLTPTHFILAFTKTFGERPHRYLIDLRLDFAAKLLAESTLPYGRVAFLCGFSSQTHLTSTMSKYRATTPAAIRRLK